MWKRIGSLSLLVTLALSGAGLLAQQPAAQGPVAQGPVAQGPELSRCSHRSAHSLWNQVDWLRLEICGGRLALRSTRCGQARMAIEPSAASSQRQTLVVDSQPGSLIVAYELTDKAGTLALEVDERHQVTVSRRRESSGEQPELLYIQPAAGSVQLIVGSSEPRTFNAPSLWQLLLAQPEAVQEFLPALDQLQPSWRLAEQLTAVRAALAAQATGDVAAEDVFAEPKQWQAWVDQLADDSFARRAEADQALRRAGQSIQVFLRQVDPATLDLEQRRRIRSILAALSDSGPDSPDRVAGWLVEDRRVWLTLMNQGQLDERLAAARHLSKLCGRTVSIDPAASPDERAEQLVQLKALLAEN